MSSTAGLALRSSASIALKPSIVQYELPSPALRPYVSAYCTIDMPRCGEQVQWFLPGPASLVLLVGTEPIEVMTFTAKYEALAAVNILSPMTRATRWVARGGTIILVEFTPLGWTMLPIAKPSRHADTVYPFEQSYFPSNVREALYHLQTLSRKSLSSPVLDDIVASLLCSLSIDSECLKLVAAALYASDTGNIKILESTVMLSRQNLARLTLHAFGMTTKMTFRLIRFLKAFEEYRHLDSPKDWCAQSRNYYDNSHFLRDATDFLGQTPRQFLLRETGLMQACMLARKGDLGSSCAMLDTSWLRMPLPARIGAMNG